MRDTGGDFFTLDINVIEGEDGVLWLSGDCDQGSVRALPVRPPGFADVTGGESPRVWLNRVIREARRDRDAGLGIGRLITETVFGPPELLQLFDQSRGVASAAGRPLLLRVFGAPDALAGWPWELMTDPADPGRPIALSRDLHLVRMPRVRTYPLRSEPASPPLNLLVILSNPISDAQASFDLYEEKRRLLADLRPLIDAGLCHVVVEDRPTIEGLRRHISRQRQGFHAVHYLGHADPRGLSLESARGKAQLVASQQFSALLQQNRNLQLVVFAGCQTAYAPDADDRMDWQGGLSVTHHVVRDAAPAVIGMQALLPFHTERIFTRTFYQALTAGQSIVQSLKLARGALWDGADGRSRQLDWAIPTLFSGGADPSAILNPEVEATPVEQARAPRLRISSTQRDLRFVSRYSALRVAVDTLSGRSRARLLCVQGVNNIAPADVSSFLDRAMAELGPEVAQLSFSARDLAGGTDASDGPRARMTRFLEEIMRQAGLAPGDYRAGDTRLDWEVLLEYLSEVPLAIALDHGDTLAPGDPVIKRIQSIVQRRGRVRVAVAHPDLRNPFNRGLDDALWQPVALPPLSWDEVWQWIQGQLPDLTRYGKDRLHAQRHLLGDRLQRWEDLALRLADEDGMTNDATLARIAADLAGSAPPPDTPASTLFFGTGTEAFGKGAGVEASGMGAEGAAPTRSGPPMPGAARHLPERRTSGPLRVAVAGPYTVGRDAQFVAAMSQYASRYGLAGHVATETDPGGAAAIVTLPSGSPFDERGAASVVQLLEWIAASVAAGADILVCDFGSTAENRALGEMLTGFARSGTLVIAAAGNEGVPVWPAWSPGILAVGPLDAEGRPFALPPDGGTKPELLAPGSLCDTPLAQWVKDPEGFGASFAALYAGAAASLVWASYRSLSGDYVARILRNTGTPVLGEEPGPRRIDLDAAVDHTRQLVVLDVLERGPHPRHRLLAETGLPSATANAALAALQEKGEVQIRIRDGDEVYLYPGSIANRYEALRRDAPSSKGRTDAQEELMRDARLLAARTSLTKEDLSALWQSDRLGPRILVLAALYERPELVSWSMLRDGIVASRSAFEQYHTLTLAERALPTLTEPERSELFRAVATQLGSRFGPNGDRGARAQAILRQCPG